MRRFFKSRFFLVSLCVTLLITALALFQTFSQRISPVHALVSESVAPGERFFSGIGEWASDAYAAFAHYDELVAENEALRLTISRLEADARDYDALAQENAMLRQMLAMKARQSGIEYLPACVLAASTGGWDNAYTLDCGRADGITDGMCAVTADGLLGVVHNVSENTCTLRLLSAAGSSCSARSARSQVTGILEGSFAPQEQGLLRLRHLEKDCDLRVGDVIETAGMGGAYPAGIAIGLVCAVESEEHALSVYALVRPFASLPGQVYIVTGFCEA